MQQVHGAAAALPVVQEVHLGSAAGAPEPSLTITKPKVNRATKRVPVSWSLSDAGADFAISVGMDEQTAKDELGMFRDHEFKNARKDWDAAWRTWCRNWKKWDAGKTKKLSYSQQLARDINANQ